MNTVLAALDRFPNLGFFAGWFALVLVLACTLLYGWTVIEVRWEDRNIGTPSRPEPRT